MPHKGLAPKLNGHHWQIIDNATELERLRIKREQLSSQALNHIDSIGLTERIRACEQISDCHKAIAMLTPRIYSL